MKQTDATAPSTSTPPQKIGYVHLGCPKNLVDTENMLGLLHERGHRIVGDETDADVILVNTCSFIEKAQEESVRQLVRLAQEGKKVVITGCLAQKYEGELLELIPEASAVVGTGDLHKIADVVEQINRGERVISVTQDPTYILEDDSQRYNVTVGSYVYLKIAEGCDYRCSFCIIPSMRGDFRSRSFESIVNDARMYGKKGVPEIILVGQDTTSYGKEIDKSLPDLLRALNEVEEIRWIRFMYAYPNLVSDELLDAIAQCDKVVKYLDCPLQHMDLEMLKLMRRPRMDHVEFVQRVRERVPGIRIRTGLIVGFPGETEERFENLLEQVERAEFDRLGVFEYSDVEGAVSRDFEGKVPKREIKRRRNAVMELQQGIALKQNRLLMDQTLDVLVDTADPNRNTFVGRTQWDAPEIDNQVLGKGPAIPGEIVQVRVTAVTPYDLKGDMVLEPVCC